MRIPYEGLVELLLQHPKSQHADLPPKWHLLPDCHLAAELGVT